MVNLTRDRVSPAPHDAFHEDVVGNVEEDETICGDAGVRECLPLGGRAREAVEEPARYHAVRHGKSFLNDTDNHVVGNQLPGIHVILRLFSHVGASRNSGSQHISGTQMDDAILLLDQFALRALSTCGRSCDDQLGRRRFGAVLFRTC